MAVPVGVRPFLVVLAGPNGAGKTTFYDLYLDGVPVPFINADRIAKSLPREAAAQDYEAAGIAEAERRRLLAERQSFITETVFSDPAGDKVRFLRQAQAAGYAVILVYVGLEHSGLAAARVAHRVRNGGHPVPLDRISARYRRSEANLRAALPSVNRAYLFDNSGASYQLVATTAGGRITHRAQRLPRWAVKALRGLAGSRRRKS